MAVNGISGSIAAAQASTIAAPANKSTDSAPAASTPAPKSGPAVTLDLSNQAAQVDSDGDGQ